MLTSLGYCSRGRCESVPRGQTSNDCIWHTHTHIRRADDPPATAARRADEGMRGESDPHRKVRCLGTGSPHASGSHQDLPLPLLTSTRSCVVDPSVLRPFRPVTCTTTIEAVDDVLVQKYKPYPYLYDHMRSQSRTNEYLALLLLLLLVRKDREGDRMDGRYTRIR